MYRQPRFLERACHREIIGDTATPTLPYSQFIECRSADRRRSAPTEVLITALTQGRSNGAIPNRTQMRSKTAFQRNEPAIARGRTEMIIDQGRHQRPQPPSIRPGICVDKHKNLATRISLQPSRSQVVHLLSALCSRTGYYIPCHCIHAVLPRVLNLGANLID